MIQNLIRIEERQVDNYNMTTAKIEMCTVLWKDRRGRYYSILLLNYLQAVVFGGFFGL